MGCCRVSSLTSTIRARSAVCSSSCGGDRQVQIERGRTAEALIVKNLDPKVDDGKKKVSIFFNTQTTEGFTKALTDEVNAR